MSWSNSNNRTSSTSSTSGSWINNNSSRNNTTTQSRTGMTSSTNSYSTFKSSSTTGTAWGPAYTASRGFDQSKPITSSFSSSTSRLTTQLNLPTSIGIPYAPVPQRDITANSNVEIEFEILHISFFGMFQDLTVEQLRYYDYVMGGGINKPNIPTSTTGGTTTTQVSTMQRTGFRGTQATPTKDVPPWHYDWTKKAIAPIPSESKNQPFGAIESSRLSIAAHEAETISYKKPLKPIYLKGLVEKGEPQKSKTPYVFQPFTFRKDSSATTLNSGSPKEPYGSPIVSIASPSSFLFPQIPLDNENEQEQRYNDGLVFIPKDSFDSDTTKTGIIAFKRGFISLSFVSSSIRKIIKVSAIVNDQIISLLPEAHDIPHDDLKNAFVFLSFSSQDANHIRAVFERQGFEIVDFDEEKGEIKCQGNLLCLPVEL